MIIGRTHLKETVVATIKFSRSLNLYSRSISLPSPPLLLELRPLIH